VTAEWIKMQANETKLQDIIEGTVGIKKSGMLYGMI
jgi:hypothetical protein